MIIMCQMIVLGYGEKFEQYRQDGHRVYISEADKDKAQEKELGAHEQTNSDTCGDLCF